MGNLPGNCSCNKNDLADPLNASERSMENSTLGRKL